MRLRPTYFLSLALALTGRAQETLNPPTPLAPAVEIPAGGNQLSREAARRAQELGFPSIAVGLYRELLAAPGDGANRSELSLELATALLDAGRAGEAEQALAGDPGPHLSAWHLREGMAEAQSRRMIPARAEVAAVKADELTARDRPWYLFLQGMLVDETDPGRAGNFYDEAEKAADSDFSRARFILAHEQALLRMGPVNEGMADQARQNAERFSGTAIGYGFERAYAVTLDALGRKSEAVEALQRDLLSLPATERTRADDFRLLLGMIAGGADGLGRVALIQLLETGGDRDRQRVALRLLASALGKDPGRSFFRGELLKLIALEPAHPILDDLLLVRAELALGDNDFPSAEAAAIALLQKFPGSSLKPYALGILVGSAWDQRRYRTAADYARQTRDSLPSGGAKARLSVVEAEAWFRAGSFREAADAYAAVLRDPPPGIPPGDLMYQRVEAEIQLANQLNTTEEIRVRLQGAASALDELAQNKAFDTVNRWKAEWSLTRALEVADEIPVAYDRVNRLLATTVAAGQGLPAELRVRMAWLQARLTLHLTPPDPAKALKLLEGITGGMLNELNPDLRIRIASSDELMRAQANYDLKRDSVAEGILTKLVEDYPQTEAAAESYLVEAQHYVAIGQIATAQQRFTKMAEQFPHSDHAASALYLAATMAEQLGQVKNLDEADQLLDRLYKTYPNSDLVFDARLEQGNVLRLLNQFQPAQHAYDALINLYPLHKDVILAKLALADCHNAQLSSDPAHEENARLIYEDICFRTDASIDVRVEAGYKLGLISRRRGRLDDAAQIWWVHVVTEFLLHPETAKELETKGRYWMARTLMDLGALYQQQGKLDDAGNAWNRILESKLPFEADARANLASLNQAPAKP